MTGTSFPPELDVDEDRDRFRLRARVGLGADLADGFSAGLRIATGESNSPVTTNQSLGLAGTTQGGNFSKYQIWLDRAFIRYEPIKDETASVGLTIGRFDNPFFSTDLIWDDDIGFDGAALQASYKVAPGVTPFLTVGAFPVFNTDFNFATNSPTKFDSHDKYLYGAQVGTSWDVSQDVGVKFGVAFYDFENIEGELSNPCIVVTAQDSCDTDATRPTFAQKGNSYMALRSIVANAANGFGTTNQLQYFGLATPFRELALTGRVEVKAWDPIRVALDGEYVKNLGFDEGRLEDKSVNNRDSAPAGVLGDFVGGDTGYFIRLTAGDLPGNSDDWQFGNWSVSLGYKYLESDAVVDAFTDSDFGLGGTNLEGYIAGGKLAFTSGVFAEVRWLSADSIDGPPFSVDIIQADINARF